MMKMVPDASGTTINLVDREPLTISQSIDLAGTNVEEGKKILSDSGLKIIPADDLDDAAVKIVSAVKEIS